MGYDVDTDMVRTASSRLTAGGEFLGAARKTVGTRDVPAAAFGRSAAAKSLAAGIQQAVQLRRDNLDRRIAALQSLAQRLHDAADTYDGLEEAARQDTTHVQEQIR